MLRSALLCLAVVACAPAPVAPVEPSGEVPSDISLQNVTARVWHGSTLRARATAARLDFRRQGSQFTATVTRAELLEHGATITAPLAEGNLAAHQVELSGGAHLAGRDGLQADTERARFDGQAAEEGTASGLSPVSVTAPGLSLRAAGFVYEVKGQRCEFAGPVATHFEGAAR